MSPPADEDEDEDGDGQVEGEGDEQDAMAAEWEAALATEGGDGTGEEGGGDGGNGGDGGDQDDLAAEWEAMMSGGGDAAAATSSTGRESTRVLNQDEIDSLLGFDDEHDEGSDRTGIQAILNSALVSYERLWCMDLRISISGSASVFESLSCLSSSTHRVATISPEPSTGS